MFSLTALTFLNDNKGLHTPFGDMMPSLMVGVLTFGSSGTGSSLGWEHCAVLLSKTLYLSPLRCINDVIASHPVGNRNTYHCFMLQKREISPDLIGC